MTPTRTPVAGQAGARAQRLEAQGAVALGRDGADGGHRVAGQGDVADAGQREQGAQPGRRHDELRVAEVGPPDLRLDAQRGQRGGGRPGPPQPHRDLHRAGVVEAQAAQRDGVAQGLARRDGAVPVEAVRIDGDAGGVEPLGLAGEGVEQRRQGIGLLGAQRGAGGHGEGQQQRDEQRRGRGPAQAATRRRTPAPRSPPWKLQRQSRRQSHQQPLPRRDAWSRGPSPSAVWVTTLHARREGRAGLARRAVGVGLAAMTHVSPTPPRAIVPAPAASRFRTRGFVWWLPLVVAAVAAVAAFALSERQEQVYESRAALLAPESGPLTPEALVAELQREVVFAQTISALQLDTTAEALRERIDVRSEGIVIEVLARAPSPREAEALARVFLSEARDPRVTDHGALLTPYRQPLLPQRRAGGDTARNTAAAVAGGLVVGLGLALLVSGREPARPARHRRHAADGLARAGVAAARAPPAGRRRAR